MHTHTLRPGDRIRVGSLNRVRRYRPGDTGIVRRGPRTSSISGVTFYVVSMDRDGHAWNVVFKADEIEPTACPRRDAGIPG